MLTLTYNSRDIKANFVRFLEERTIIVKIKDVTHCLSIRRRNQVLQLSLSHTN